MTLGHLTLQGTGMGLVVSTHTTQVPTWPPSAQSLDLPMDTPIHLSNPMDVGSRLPATCSLESIPTVSTLLQASVVPSWTWTASSLVSRFWPLVTWAQSSQSDHLGQRLRMQGPAARQGKKDQAHRGPGPGEAGKDRPALHPSSSQRCPVDTQAQRGRFSKGAWNLKRISAWNCANRTRSVRLS